MNTKDLVSRAIGTYQEGDNKTVISYRDSKGRLTTKTIKRSKFVKAIHRLGKSLKAHVSADLAEDQRLFQTGYL